MLNRRDFLKKAAILGLGSTLYPAGRSFGARDLGRKKVFVLGIDGMDVQLARKFMARGLMPNCSRLARTGGMRATMSSFPPQSPVAWSSFSVGASSQVHGIYDFIHRDPKTMLPFHSTAEVVGSDKTLNIGDWKIPLAGGEVNLLRHGKPFWEFLAERDIPATVFKMPANFPCEHEKVRMVSGMGTPDLRGGYGNYTLFTTSSRFESADIAGGTLERLEFRDNMAVAQLKGPVNTLRQGSPETRIPITVWRDPANKAARLKIQDKDFVLKQGDWTGWITVKFDMIPHLSEVSGICKIYIKQVHPDFVMYVSPINIDPSDPVLPIISSAAYQEELAANIGLFYTQGLPADTNALSSSVLSDGEYLELAHQILSERVAMLDFELKRFVRQDAGLLFFYISSLDQDSHMFWRTQDPSHPMYSEKLGKTYGDLMMHMYAGMDRLVGKVLDQIDINDPDVTLIAMSDHGFAPFRRQVNVNTWLYEQGYIDLVNYDQLESHDFFGNVNWSSTAAYSVGINALYLNIAGREKSGIIPQSQSQQLLNNIQQGLLALRDPETGERVVSRVLIVPAKERLSNPTAPDMIIGWNRGYRSSWEGILGGFSREVVSDNNDKWSGDHCIDPAVVPAVLFCNKTITRKAPALVDITATILAEYNIPIPDYMEGSPLYPL